MKYKQNKNKQKIIIYYYITVYNDNIILLFIFNLVSNFIIRNKVIRKLFINKYFSITRSKFYTFLS